MEKTQQADAAYRDRVPKVQASQSFRSRSGEWLKVLVIGIGLAYLLVGLLAFTFWALTLASRQVKAHEAPSGWNYPIECCFSIDCAPISKWEHDPVSGMVKLKTKHGEASTTTEWIEKNKRKSGDGSNHACITNDSNGHPYVRCVFISPGI